MSHERSVHIRKRQHQSTMVAGDGVRAEFASGEGEIVSTDEWLETIAETYAKDLAVGLKLNGSYQSLVRGRLLNALREAAARVKDDWRGAVSRVEMDHIRAQHEWEKRIAELKSERDRYRDALDRIKGGGVWNERHQRRDFEMIEIASAALANRQPSPKEKS